jgi:hypothetical protein
MSRGFSRPWQPLFIIVQVTASSSLLGLASDNYSIDNEFLNTKIMMVGFLSNIDIITSISLGHHATHYHIGTL